jgi:hyaluronoglucosaminidase
VVNAQSDTVTPIAIATNRAGPAIKVGHNPGAIAISPDGKTAYVANYVAGTVTSTFALSHFRTFALLW